MMRLVWGTAVVSAVVVVFACSSSDSRPPVYDNVYPDGAPPMMGGSLSNGDSDGGITAPNLPVGQGFEVGEAGNNTRVKMSKDGRFLVFKSADEPVAGANPDGSFELFSLDIEASVLRQLTDIPSPTAPGPEGFESIHVTSDGSTVIYAFSGAEFRSISTIGESPQLLFRFGGGTLWQMAISGDGSRIGYDLGQGIVVAGADGSSPVTVAPSGLTEPLQPFSLSEDGMWVAWAGRVDPDSGSEVPLALFAANTETGEATKVIDLDELTVIERPEISGDGSWIAYVAEDADRNKTLFKIDRSGENHEEIASDFTLPSGQLVDRYVGVAGTDVLTYIVRDDNVADAIPGWGTRVLDFTTGETTLITDTVGRYPSVSGDGKRVGYMSVKNVIVAGTDLGDFSAPPTGRVVDNPVMF